MAKTVFSDGNASLGIPGTRVWAAFLNKIFGHRHTGQDDDGYAPKISLAELEAAVADRLLPVGSVIHTAAATAPAGFLKANGAAISRATYAALFAAIGTTYGPGDDLTTFNLPDLRGEFLRGLDDGRAVDAGRVLGTAQSAQVGQHNLPVRTTDYDNSAAPIWFSSKTALAAGIAPINSDSWEGYGNLGTETDHSNTVLAGLETRPRNIALLACIKY